MAPETVFFVLALSVGAAMGSSLEWNMFGEYVDFSVLFVLIFLRHSQQYFSHVWTISCLPGLNQY